MSKDAIELAREYGVDIEQLRAFRKLTPIQRLRQLQSMANFVLKCRTAIQLQKEKAKHDKSTRLRIAHPNLS